MKIVNPHRVKSKRRFVANSALRPKGKSVTLCGNGGGIGANTGLYLCPFNYLSDAEMNYMARSTTRNRTHLDFGYCMISSDDKSKCVTKNFCKGVPYNVLIDQYRDCYSGAPIYTVAGGKLCGTDLGLPDGEYVVRKLTPVECERLQTLPDDYTSGISNKQRYKCLGNGWTAEVITHILGHLLANVPRDEDLLVLSMYDGIGTGMYCLDKLGFTNVKYHAFETDYYAIQVALKNYPDIIEHGDAFAVSAFLSDGDV